MVPSLRGVVACPVCLRLFTVSDFESGRLTRGHSLPKSLGNPFHTLLCHRCNGKASRNEAHLKRYGNERWGLPTRPNERVPVEALGKRYRGTIQQAPSAQSGQLERTLEIKPELGSRRPWATMELAQSIEAELRARRNAGHPYSIHDVIAIRWHYDIRRVRLALLTAAYLDAFMRLGYAFVLNSNLDLIRAAILDPTPRDLAELACISCTADHRSIFFASAPPEFVCIAVAYYDLIVILPAAADRSAVVYDRLSAIKQGLRDWASPPFNELLKVPDRSYPHGRYSVNRDGQETCITQPDLACIRRLDPFADGSLACLRDAPAWARVA